MVFGSSVPPGRLTKNPDAAKLIMAGGVDRGAHGERKTENP